MSELAVLKLGMLAFSLVALLIYAVRRLDDAAGLSSLADQAPVERQITPAELAVLQPFLAGFGLDKGKPAALRSPAVLRLEGPYRTHGVHVQGTSILHATLGGVDVVLPFDAADHLAEHNRALVVLTAKQAIVLALNDSFDIVSAQARAMRPDGPVDGAAVATPSFTTLTERQETPLEAGWRATQTHPWVAAVLVFGGLLCGAFWGHASTGWLADLSLLAALALLGAGLCLTQRGLGRQQPGAVQRLRGTLLKAQAVSANGAGLVHTAFLVGGQARIEVPGRWLPHLPMGQEAEFAVRSKDRQLLSAGTHLSVERELREFPAVHWGRYLLIGLLALGAAGVMVVASGDVRGDAVHAWAALEHGTNKPEAGPPRAGQFWSHEGPARCQLADGAALALQCETLRLSSRTTPVALPEPSADVTAFWQGHWLRASTNFLARQLAMMNGDPLAAYGLNQPKMVTNLDEIVARIDRLCAQPDEALASACQAIHSALIQNLETGDGQPLTDWAQLRGLGAAMLNLDDGSHSRWLAAGSVFGDALLQAQLAPHTDALLAAETGGWTVQLAPGWHLSAAGAAALAPLRAPPPATDDAEAAAQRAAEATPAADGEERMPLARYAALQRWAQGEAGPRLALTGLVTRSRDGGSSWEVQLDPTRTLANARPAARRTASLAVALVLAGLGLVAGTWRGCLAWRRENALAAHWRRVLG